MCLKSCKKVFKTLLQFFFFFLQNFFFYSIVWFQNFHVFFQIDNDILLRRSSSLRQGLPNVGVNTGRRKSSLEEIGISHFTTLMQATNHTNPIKIALNGSIGLEVSLQHTHSNTISLYLSSSLALFSVFYLIFQRIASHCRSHLPRSLHLFWVCRVLCRLPAKVTV